MNARQTQNNNANCRMHLGRMLQKRWNEQESCGAEKILTAEGDQPQWDHDGVSEPPLLSSTCRQSDSESSIWTSRYLCVRPDSRHADACPAAAAGTQGLLTQMWWACKKLQERSINPQVSGPLTLYIPAAPHSPPYFSLRRSELERKTSGSVN